MSESIEVIFNDFIADDDLHQFEDKYEKAFKVGSVSAHMTFEYGWALVRSRYKDDVSKGVSLLEGLCNTTLDQREFIFFLSFGYYKIEEYSKALKCVKRLMTIEPNNRQGLSLEEAIKKKMKSRGLMGMAFVAGAAALVGIFIGAAVSKN